MREVPYVAKATAAGFWVKDGNGYVSIDTSYHSLWWDQLNQEHTCLRGGTFKDDTDGFVKTKVGWSGFFGGVELPEHVQSYGVYNWGNGGLGSCAWQRGSWNDDSCP